MQASFRVACAIALAVGATDAALAADVSVSVGAPGFYGSIDLGGYPQPQTIYAQPVVIDRGPAVEAPPLYLRVPPGQERQWRRYCRQYDACGRPVYFVRDDWYRNVYTPRYREVHARGDDRGPRGYEEDRGRGRPERDDRGGYRGDRGDHGGDRGGRGGDRGDRGDRGGERDGDRGHDDGDHRR